MRFAANDLNVQQDGASASLTAPSGTSQRRLLRAACEAAGIGDAWGVSSVEAHGTGTALGDPVEMGSMAVTT